jgi:hypothetical protein
MRAIVRGAGHASAGNRLAASIGHRNTVLTRASAASVSTMTGAWGLLHVLEIFDAARMVGLGLVGTKREEKNTSSWLNEVFNRIWRVSVDMGQGIPFAGQ